MEKRNGKALLPIFVFVVLYLGLEKVKTKLQKFIKKIK